MVAAALTAKCYNHFFHIVVIRSRHIGNTMNHRLIGLTGPPEDKESTSMKWLGTIVIPLGAVLFAVIDRYSREGLSTSKGDFLLYAYVVGVILLIAYELRRPVGGLLAALRLRFIRQRLDQAFLPELIRFHSQMAPMVGDNTDNIARIARDVDGWPEAQGANVHNYGYVQTLRNWHDVLQANLTAQSRPAFPLLINELSSLIYQMNDYWNSVHSKLEALANANKLPEGRLRQLRKDWAMRRETHEHFMSAWREFSRRVNQEYGARVCNDYYSQLPPLA